MLVGGMCSLLPCYLLPFATGYAFKTVFKKKRKNKTFAVHFFILFLKLVSIN